MEEEGAGDAGAQQMQYVTDDQQQQYVLPGNGVETQPLLQGAKIVDGQIVLPQGYASDAGETVILMYETPDGQQQFMTEDGQQIVFQQEGEDGQTLLDPQQMIAQIQEGQQQVDEQEMQVMVSEGQQLISVDQSQIAPGQSLLAPGVTLAASEHSQISPGQSLLTGQTTFVQENEDGTTTVVTDPEQIAAVLAQQQLQQEHFEAVEQHHGHSSTMVSESEGMSILSQAVSAIERGETIPPAVAIQSSDSQQISVHTLQQDAALPQTVQYENYNLPITSEMIKSEGPTTLIADGKEIQVQVLSNADFAATQGHMAGEPLPETLRLRNNIKQEETNETQEIQIVMKTDESGQEYTQIISEGDTLKAEDGQLVLPNMDPNSPEMAMLLERIRQGHVQVAEDGTIIVSAEDLKGDYSQMEGLMIAEPKMEMPDYDFGPGVINPETGLMEEPDESEFVEPEPDIAHEELFVNVGDTDDILDQANAMRREGDVKLQVEIFNEGSNKAEVTIVSVPGKGKDGKRQLVELEKSHESDESDFDEENLTPKVVYERLLAQHRRTKECQVCGELLDNFLRLKEHLMEHAGYNPCECQKCGRILGTPEGRYRHEKAHEKHGSPTKGGITPAQKVTCTVCGKTIARKEHLKRHMLIHQDCPTYKCLLCGYSFKREDLIKGHVKKFHPKQVEASSLDLLFEKSSDETAPERSQWNPHRKYRTTPKPPKVPGRGRGRPRKDQAKAADQYAKDIIIKTPDGNVVTSKMTPDPFSNIIIHTEDGKVIKPPKKTPKSSRVARPPKTLKYEDDEDYNYQDNSSEDGADQLLVRHAPEDVNAASEASLDSMLSAERPSKTTKVKKARSVAVQRILGGQKVPIWGQKKSVKVSFVGIGEEVKEAYQSFTTEIEEEIVVFMGNQGGNEAGKQVKTVKFVKTPYSGKKKAFSPNSTPKVKLLGKSPVKTPGTEMSRSGRIIQRRVQADGELIDVPVIKSENNIVNANASTSSMMVDFDLDLSDLNGIMDGVEPGAALEEFAHGTKRPSQQDDDDGEATPEAKRSRQEEPSDAVVAAEPEDEELKSEKKTVKCSTPQGKGVQEIIVGSKTSAAELTTEEGTSESTAAASAEGETTVSTEDAEYGTVTIEQGRIVGEIKLN